MPYTNKFPKQHKLTGEIRVAKLYTEGDAFISYPLRVVYLSDEKDDKVPAKVVISVPKKRFKRAHDRNLLKRRIREAYRLNRSPLWEYLSDKDFSLNLGINYVSDEALPYEKIEKKMQDAFEKLIKRLDEKRD